MTRRKPAMDYRWCIGTFVLALCAVSASAQEGGLRTYQEQLRVKLDEQSPEARQMAVDAGGWLNFAYFTYDDPTGRKQRTLREYDLRAWASANVQNTHRFYVRGAMSFQDWNPGTNPAGFGREDDYEDPFVERAWYEFDLAGLTRASGKAPDNDFKFKVGREFTEIGTDLALALPLDMVKGTLQLRDWEWMTFLGKTVPDSPNIDQSGPVDDQDRTFWGSQLTYTGLDHHRPFVYFLNNQDNTDDEPVNGQRYEYDSHYVGGGSTGSLFLPDLKYQTELVGEWGKTYSWGADHGRDSIAALAYDAMLEYYFQVPTHPKVMAEYLYGSGDKDRAFSSTNTIGGNARGTEDNAFNAFGFRDTGIALAPRVSNLHIYVTGASFFPLEKIKLLRKMELGTRFYWYQKATGGAISDTTATDGGDFVGWEGDVFIDWRITSDLSWTIRYGGFVPGSSYSRGSNDGRNFLFTGMTYSF